MKKIDSFTGEYDFLSNFYECNIHYDGLTYSSTEAAYQAAKCQDPQMRNVFTRLEPDAAKKLGRSIEVRQDWEDVKLPIMRDLLYTKFLLNPKLLQKLLDTGDAELVEGNTWNDTFWGVCGGVGDNNLGRLLMEVRQDLANQLFNV